MVELSNIAFSYGADSPAGQTAIQGISLSAKPGECVLFCGPSGSGKSTVLKVVNGVIPHFSSGNLDGRMSVADKDVSGMPLHERSALVASVFQNPKSQFFNTDVESEIAFPLENRGVAVEEIDRRLAQITKELHLEGLRGKSMFALSGGQKQRIAFASAAIAQTPVIVLDEPSANLDAASTDFIAATIRTLKERGATVLIAEHRLGYLRDIVDTAYLMEEGEIKYSMTRSELFGMSEAERRKLGLRSLATDVAGALGRTAVPAFADAAHGTTPAPNRVAASNGQPFLSIRDLTLAHKRSIVLQNLSLDVYPGEIVGLVGPNGTGKTTLLRTLAGLVKQRRGAVLLEGKVAPARQRRSSMGMVMQDVNHQLFSDSVLHECLLGNPQLTSAGAMALLDKVGLSAFADRHPMSLSGGQKQRLAIAVAAASCKSVLLLDEPTSGLDYRSMMAVGAVLKQLAVEGMPIVVATHDGELVEAVCTRIEELVPA